MWNVMFQLSFLKLNNVISIHSHCSLQYFIIDFSRQIHHQPENIYNQGSFPWLRSLLSFYSIPPSILTLKIAYACRGLILHFNFLFELSITLSKFWTIELSQPRIGSS